MSGGGAAALFAGKDALPFGRRQRRSGGPRLPVVAVTGFLGSGKTTLIRALLDKPEGANTAVVVNEYGEIGIDNALLRSSSDVTVLLGNGCLCCNFRTDLQDTLRGLFADRVRGAVPSFERVVIETSGLADPGPVLQTFATDRGLGREFHLQALICVVDAVNGKRNIEQMREARKQVALADRIVVTKSDLADAATTTHLIERLGALNAAPVGVAVDGEIEPSAFTKAVILVANLAEKTQIVHSHLVGGLRPDNPLAQAPYLAAPYSLSTPGGIAALNAEVTRQAAMVAYIDNFRLMMLIALATLPVLLLLRGGRHRPLTAAADD
jgi:Ni2+-binding GTPase involved in maturation of urease and hydrogenase